MGGHDVVDVWEVDAALLGLDGHQDIIVAALHAVHKTLPQPEGKRCFSLIYRLSCHSPDGCLIRPERIFVLFFPQLLVLSQTDRVGKTVSIPNPDFTERVYHHRQEPCVLHDDQHIPAEPGNNGSDDLQPCNSKSVVLLVAPDHRIQMRHIGWHLGRRHLDVPTVNRPDLGGAVLSVHVRQGYLFVADDGGQMQPGHVLRLAVLQFQ
mmetsp:Transcript_71877/g.233614  ORF Transcript_71877/g.233614 Transcript_71877/m.233614 type:complete len:207 (+) Transcript_71877:574-1194(+)